MGSNTVLLLNRGGFLHSGDRIPLPHMVKKRKRQSHNSAEVVVPLKAIREQLGMTQAEFAVAIGIDPSTVSRCERGMSEPSLTILQTKRLCKLVEKGLDELPDYLGKHPEQTMS